MAVFESTNPKNLVLTLGGNWFHSYGVASCPVCQPQKRKDQNALTIKGDGNRLLLHCKKTGCDFRDILTAAGVTPGTVEIDQMAIEAAAQSRAAQTAKLRARARSLWDYGKAIQGSKGEAYLRARGITCAMPDSLRWLPDTYHGPSSKYCAAMIADVALTGGVHRTFFTKRGQRLDKSAKMMLGPCSGGAVRLSDAIGPLVVCEGIETGLSLLSGLLRGPATVWAALSTSGIQGLTLPTQAGDLIIATDNDDSGAGKDAGDALARTAYALGWNVSLFPAPTGMDWNDALQIEVAS